MIYERNYELASLDSRRHEPLEYSSSGYITAIDSHKIVAAPLIETKRFGSPIIQGFACVYNKPHIYKGQIEVFERDCFKLVLDSKCTVQFLIDHKHACFLGDTDSNLELFDTDVGLAFRMSLSPGELKRLDGRDAMSVSYLEMAVETQTIAGEQVRFIKSAKLSEISLCYRGAVKQTHAMVRDASDVGPLRYDAKSSFAGDSAYFAVKRSFQAISEQLG